MTALVNNPIDECLGNVGGTVLVVDPSAGTIEELVEGASEVDEPPAVRLLAEDGTLKTVLEDFLVASTAADLVADDVLHVRAARATPGNEIVLTDERVTAIVAAGETVVGLATDDAAFVDTANEHYAEVWEAADPYSLRTPPLSRVRETLREEIGDDAEADFTAVLDSLETARGDGDGLDEVTISLLVAAKNEELLYDISKWGEDVGIASKATFSRTKTALEDLGLIDTEKVPIDVGRPRLRLKFARGELRDASADELASVARGLIA